MKNGVIQTEAQAYSVPNFCHAHGISKGLFYLLQQRGSGPQIMKIGRTTLVSKEAAAKWRERMEAKSA
jgi:hypothetical protein